MPAHDLNHNPGSIGTLLEDIRYLTHVLDEAFYQAYVDTLRHSPLGIECSNYYASDNGFRYKSGTFTGESGVNHDNYRLHDALIKMVYDKTNHVMEHGLKQCRTSELRAIFQDAEVSFWLKSFLGVSHFDVNRTNDYADKWIKKLSHSLPSLKAVSKKELIQDLSLIFAQVIVQRHARPDSLQIAAIGDHRTREITALLAAEAQKSYTTDLGRPGTQKNTTAYQNHVLQWSIGFIDQLKNAPSAILPTQTPSLKTNFITIRPRHSVKVAHNAHISVSIPSGAALSETHALLIKIQELVLFLRRAYQDAYLDTGSYAPCLNTPDLSFISSGQRLTEAHRQVVKQAVARMSFDKVFQALSLKLQSEPNKNLEQFQKEPCVRALLKYFLDPVAAPLAANHKDNLAEIWYEKLFIFFPELKVLPLSFLGDKLKNLHGITPKPIQYFKASGKSLSATELKISKVLLMGSDACTDDDTASWDYISHVQHWAQTYVKNLTEPCLRSTSVPLSGASSSDAILRDSTKGSFQLAQPKAIRHQSHLGLKRTYGAASDRDAPPLQLQNDSASLERPAKNRKH